MNDEKREDQCIERRNIMDTAHYYSVSEYEKDCNWAQRLNGPKAKSFFGVIWTRDAPRIEDLTTDWQKTKEGRFRICDPELYNAQMRRFVGLD